MNMKPSNRQCELARAITKSKASDHLIKKELNCTTQKEWDEMCVVLDKLLIKHNRPFDDLGWESLVEDFISVSAPEGIDEATLLIAYMNWMNQ